MPYLIISAVTEIGHSQSPEATMISEFDKRMDTLNNRINGMEEKMDLIIRLLQEKER